ncbi:hypothetical protein ACFPIJ_19300 [Dactylosporangium cerinum]|uniref:Lipoprotein n=1 Tax=Dactylosporangium cerinum TaxID=1434730 RepID=A0ABV9VWN7_9ACTN
MTALDGGVAVKAFRLVVCAALLVASGANAGCTPREVFLAAMAWVDGRPVIVLAPCKGSQVRRVSLFEDPAPLWEVAAPQAVDYAEIPLFTTPDGWTQTQGALQELRDDRTYVAGGDIVGRSSVSGVQFTPPMLKDLGPYEVLAQPGKKAEKMSRKAYRKYARDAC